MKRTIAGAYFGLICSVSSGLAQGCPADKIELRSKTTTVQFTVEIADDADERAQGLMNRESLPQFASMLFVYESPRFASFWMKNTLIPLDMLFADEGGVVRHIHSMAQPLDTTPIPGGDDIQYVLEINGGMSEMLGLEVGAELRHPAIDPDLAAWPCDE